MHLDLIPTPRSAESTGVPLTMADVRLDPASRGADPVLLDAVRSAAGDGSAAPGPVLTVRVDVGGDPSLPAEGYALTVTGPAAEPRAVIDATDPAGAHYGMMTLAQLVTREGAESRVPQVAIRDWPELAWRGTIEGFYGPPWSHADRLEHLRFAGRHKFNTYVYAPKDDPFHRAQWRDPYPDAELARLRELVAAAEAAHIRFVFTISPGLSMVYSDPAELDRLFAKLKQVWDIGVRDIGLLFDDIEPELTHRADIEAFGAEPGSSALAHAAVCRQVADRFLAARGSDRPLLMVATDYAGVDRSPYRDLLARELPADVLVWWTGHDVVVGDVTRAHLDAAAASFGHRLLLWDNFPVNDFDFSRLFLGPLLGRTPDLAGEPLAGITANPMPQRAASEIALATVADWAWNPEAYQSGVSHRRVRDLLGTAGAVETLIDACRSWPPSAPRHPGLSALLDEVLAGSPAAADRARAAFTAMTGPVPDDGPSRLIRDVRPWLDAQAAMGRAGLAALDHLASPSDATRDAAERALADARKHDADVLKPIIPPFVEQVLAS